MFSHFSLFIVKNLESSTALSVVHLSPLGSQVSFAANATTRIENVVDWVQIANKYRTLVGDDEDKSSISHTDSDDKSNATEAPGHAAPLVGNNINANSGKENQV